MRAERPRGEARDHVCVARDERVADAEEEASPVVISSPPPRADLKSLRARLWTLASRLAPVEQAFGWSLVDANGLPTSNAYAFLGAAVLAQLAIAAALAAPLRDAFSLG